MRKKGLSLRFAIILCVASVFCLGNGPTSRSVLRSITRAHNVMTRTTKAPKRAKRFRDLIKLSLVEIFKHHKKIFAAYKSAEKGAGFVTFDNASCAASPKTDYQLDIRGYKGIHVILIFCRETDTTNLFTLSKAAFIHRNATVAMSERAAATFVYLAGLSFLTQAVKANGMENAPDGYEKILKKTVHLILAQWKKGHSQDASNLSEKASELLARIKHLDFFYQQLFKEKLPTSFSGANHKARSSFLASLRFVALETEKFAEVMFARWMLKYMVKDQLFPECRTTDCVKTLLMKDLSAWFSDSILYSLGLREMKASSPLLRDRLKSNRPKPQKKADYEPRWKGYFILFVVLPLILAIGIIIALWGFDIEFRVENLFFAIALTSLATTIGVAATVSWFGTSFKLSYYFPLFLLIALPLAAYLVLLIHGYVWTVSFLRKTVFAKRIARKERARQTFTEYSQINAELLRSLEGLSSHFTPEETAEFNSLSTNSNTLIADFNSSKPDLKKVKRASRLNIFNFRLYHLEKELQERKIDQAEAAATKKITDILKHDKEEREKYAVERKKQQSESSKAAIPVWLDKVTAALRECTDEDLKETIIKELQELKPAIQSGKRANKSLKALQRLHDKLQKA